MRAECDCFSPAALTLSPQTVSDHLPDIGGAPAALVAISNGSFQGSATSGTRDDGGDAAQPHQSIEIGSQTKMMTAAIVLQLVEEGLLDLDQTLSHYLDPSLTQGVANADVATLSQALNMTTGIPNYTEVERHDGTTMLEIIEDQPEEIFDAEEIVTLLNGLPASAPAGDGYAYSNTNYFYLSQVIETVTGQTLAEVSQERIFDPLNMQDSFVNDFRNDPDRLSSYLEIDGDVFDVTDVLVDANGEGGVISTTADMITFMQALLVDQTLVSPEILATMTGFENGSVDERGFVFNAGLVYLEVEGVGSFVGFSGGSLGTDSATYLHLESGRIISLAVTQSNLDIDATSGLLYSDLLAEQDPAWTSGYIEGPIQIDGISAADPGFAAMDGTTTFLTGDAAMTLGGRLRDFDSDDFQFSDGSRLLLGGQDNDVLRISRSDDTASTGDNQLRGFGGDDHLSGGRGDDDLRRGAGNDVLQGRRGDDRLNGGNGADVFIFRGQTNDGITDFDVIADFQVGIDTLVLGNRNVTDVTQHTDGIDLTLDGVADTIFLAGVSDITDLSFL